MADPKKDHEYWRKQGEQLVRSSGSAGLPPIKKDEYFTGGDRDTAYVGDSVVSFPRPSGDPVKVEKGGSVMSRMMSANRDAADENQRDQKRRRYYGE